MRRYDSTLGNAVLANPLRDAKAESRAHNRLDHVERQNGDIEIRKEKRSEWQKEAADQPGTERLQDDWMVRHGVPLNYSRCSAIMQPVRSRSIPRRRPG